MEETEEGISVEVETLPEGDVSVSTDDSQTRAAEFVPGAWSNRAHAPHTATFEVIDHANRTVQMSFASEYPATQKYKFGQVVETVEMSERAADLTRLNNGGPLLFQHDPDKQIGVIERAWIGEDKRGYAVVRFSKVGLGADIFTDVVDGIRRNVSHGYEPKDGDITPAKRAGELDQLNVTSWAGREISIVSVPADPTIGVGRSASTETAEGSEETPIEPAATISTETTTQLERGSDVMEREDQILEFGKKFGAEDMARSFALDPNKSLADFRTALLEVEAAKQRKQTVETQPTNLDLDKKEVKEYSITRAIRNIVNGKRDSFEFECSAEIAKRMNKDIALNGLLVPLDIQMRGYQRRDLTVGLGSQPGDGGALVGTDHLSGSFIDMLRTNMVMMSLGVRMLSGLVGNVNIPRQDSAATGYWVSEGNAPTESQLGVGQLTLSPKTVGAVSEYTRLLYLQSAPSIDQLVFSDLAQVLARSIDLAIINGDSSGASGQPDGILNTTGVVDGTVGSGNGASFDWPDAVNMETTIESANAPSGRAYLTTPSIRGTLKTRAKIGSTFPVFLCENNQMNGYPVVTSTQVPAQAGIFGDYSQIILGEWGVLELVANPFSSGFRAGNVEVRGLQTVDVAIRYPQALTKFEAFS